MKSLLKWFVVMGLVVALAGLALKFWLAPHLVQALARRALPELWTGPLSVKSVELNFFAPSVLRGLELRDAQGRAWLSIGSLRLAFRGRNGLPILSEVTVEDAMLTAYFDHGHCRPPSPMSWPQLQDYLYAPSSYSDLQVFTLRRGALRVVDESDLSWQWKNLALDLSWTGNRGDLRLSRFSDDGENRLNLMGWTDSQTSEFNWMLAAAHRLKGPESRALLAAADAAAMGEIEGFFTVNLALQGNFTNLPALEVYGNATVNDVRAQDSANQPVLVDGNAVLDFSGTEGRLTSAFADALAWTVDTRNAPIRYEAGSRCLAVDFTNLLVQLKSASVHSPFWSSLMSGVRADGRLNLSGRVQKELAAGLPLQYALTGQGALASLRLPEPISIQFSNFQAAAFTVHNGAFSVEPFSAQACGGTVDGLARLCWTNDTYEAGIIFSNLNLQTLFADLQIESHSARGLATGKARFTGTSFSRQGLAAKAQFLIEGAAMDASPLFSSLLKVIGVQPESVQGITDVATTLSLEWPVMTLQDLRIANRIAAFEFEPGGTYQLDTGMIDAYVVAGTLHSIHLTVLMPFMNLAKMLTRIHVRGNVSDPSERLLHKEPVADLAKGTAGFLVDTAKAGGKISESVLKTLWSPFQLIIDLPRKKSSETTP